MQQGCDISPRLVYLYSLKKGFHPAMMGANVAWCGLDGFVHVGIVWIGHKLLGPSMG